MKSLEKEELLIDYKLGELEGERKDEVEECLRNSPELQEEYRQIVNSLHFLRWIQQDKKIDEKQALKKISPHWKRKTEGWGKYNVAAAIILLLGLSFFLVFQNRSKNNESEPQLSILPGGAQTLLIISTGERIALAGQGDVIREADGTTVHIDSSGQISYQLGDSELQTEEQLFNTIVVPRGGEFIIVLPDSTKVWLNSDSKLTYPVRFGEKREVCFTGEAYFEVKKQPQPFLVRSGDFYVKVYGTEFNLNTYHKEKFEVVLIKGSVGFRSDSEMTETLLSPSQLGEINLMTGDVTVRDVDVYPYVAWKNQDMVFFNEKLESIMEKIARWYNVDVFYEDATLKHLRFSGDVKRYSGIDEFLNYLQKTAAVKFTIKQRCVCVQRK